MFVLPFDGYLHNLRKVLRTVTSEASPKIEGSFVDSTKSRIIRIYSAINKDVIY